MNNSLKALLGAALLSTVMIGCESTQSRDGQTSANSMNAAAECDGKMDGKKMDCKKMDGKKKSADCPTSAAKKDCDKSAKAKKSHCDSMKAKDCGKDCTKPCCADKTAG